MPINKRPRGAVKRLKLDSSTQKKIKREARGLNLSEAEYLKLMTHFSEAVRTASLPAGLLDNGFLKMILGNPMMMDMLKGMLRNMVSQMGQEYGKSSDAEPAPQQQQQQQWSQGWSYPQQGWHNPQGHGTEQPDNRGFGYPAWPHQQPAAKERESESSFGGWTDLFMKFFGDGK